MNDLSVDILAVFRAKRTCQGPETLAKMPLTQVATCRKDWRGQTSRHALERREVRGVGFLCCPRCAPSCSPTPPQILLCYIPLKGTKACPPSSFHVQTQVFVRHHGPACPQLLAVATRLRRSDRLLFTFSARKSSLSSSHFGELSSPNPGSTCDRTAKQRVFFRVSKACPAGALHGSICAWSKGLGLLSPPTCSPPTTPQTPRQMAKQPCKHFFRPRIRKNTSNAPIHGSLIPTDSQANALVALLPAGGLPGKIQMRLGRG